MLGRNKHPRESDGDNISRQPLLNDSQEDLHHGDGSDVVFSVDDDDAEDEYVEASALDHVESPKSPRSKSGHTVRFQEEVQVFAAPLRSTTESREAGE